VREVLDLDLRPAQRHALPRFDHRQGLARQRRLGEEVFGPLGSGRPRKGLRRDAGDRRSLQGQLTCTLHLDAATPRWREADAGPGAQGRPHPRQRLPDRRRGGRRDGAWRALPGLTNFGATSVGTLSIRRWLRPVCYQNMPDALLPLSA
jgi:2,5-dioxopentanoate dehydrogenase